MTKNISINKIIVLLTIVGLALAFYLLVSIKKAEAYSHPENIFLSDPKVVTPRCWTCLRSQSFNPKSGACEPNEGGVAIALWQPVCGCIFANKKPNFVTYSNSGTARLAGAFDSIPYLTTSEGKIINTGICPPLQCVAGSGFLTSRTSSPVPTQVSGGGILTALKNLFGGDSSTVTRAGLVIPFDSESTQNQDGVSERCTGRKPLCPPNSSSKCVIRKSNDGKIYYIWSSCTSNPPDSTSEPKFPQYPKRCLSAETMISTPNGEINVKDLKVGMLVWTLNGSGNKVKAPLINVSSVRVSDNYQVVHLVLKDGRELWVSPGHPTADGRDVAKLVAGNAYDGSTVVKTEKVNYKHDSTYDLLPAGDTGFYWANGILMGSTLK